MKIPNNSLFATAAGAAVICAVLAALYALSFGVMPLFELIGWRVPARMAPGTVGGMAITAYALVIGAVVFFIVRFIGNRAIAAINEAVSERRGAA